MESGLERYSLVAVRYVFFPQTFLQRSPQEVGLKCTSILKAKSGPYILLLPIDSALNGSFW